MKTRTTDPGTERAVVLSLAQGRTRDETARHLGISATLVARVMKKVYQDTGTGNTTAALVILARRGDLDEIEGPEQLPEPDLMPTTDVQRAIWSRLIVSSLDWRTFRDLRQAYELICREGI